MKSLLRQRRTHGGIDFGQLGGCSNSRSIRVRWNSIHLTLIVAINKMSKGCCRNNPRVKPENSGKYRRM
ncbi:hypothetical protein A6X21_21100 [Planctopirus hydrillae]|uniref:Uncharacterized protein n=1 Tax=Planctopirus hydrillae TaxID=1841610 RepID=A0A1C3EHV6_9PLAN|nr:hypothetical protein A6X21_21100 [Planctopirus hydrillae]